MFVRKLCNRSGSVSVQIISKESGRYRVVRTIGTSKDPEKVEKLVIEAKNQISHSDNQVSLFPVLSETDAAIESFLGEMTNLQVHTIGPELIFGQLFDRLGFNIIKEKLFRHIVIARLAHPTSKLKTVDYLYRSQGLEIEVDAIYRFLDKLRDKYKETVTDRDKMTPVVARNCPPISDEKPLVADRRNWQLKEKKGEMLIMKEYKHIRQLKQEGTSIKGIVAMTGYARNTVRKVLKSAADESRYQLEEEKPSTVAPFRAEITEKLKRGLKLTRIWREIREEKGFSGSYSAIRRFVRRLKRENPAAYIRFETLPGEQTQNDWSSFEVEFVNGKRIVQLSNFVLGFSRKMHGTWYDRGILPNLIDSHQRAFKVFGGLTGDFVYDNQKSVVAYRFRKEIILNGKFQKFAEYYGFKPVLCTPYKPNSKGKIERPFQYIEADFVRGRIFIDLADLNCRYEAWLEKTANQRIHGTTGKAPDALWEQERPALRSLPEKEYEYFELLSRKVATDCLISVEGNRYSLPWKYAGSTVSVKNYPDHFAAFSSTEKIAEHKKTTEKNQMIIMREHYDGLRQRREPRQLSTMQARFKMLAEHQGEEYFLGLMRHHKACISMIGPRFLRLFENYPTDLLREIISACVKHEIYDFPQLREYLRKMPTVVTVAPLSRPYHSSVEPRDLQVYAELGGTCHANC